MDHLAPKYQSLGGRAFLIFVLQKTRWSFFLLFFFFALRLGTNYIIIEDELLVQIINAALYLLVALFLLSLFAAVIAAWFDYIAFRFMIDDNALKIKTGIFNLRIEAIPYRQMQNVDIQRDLTYRLLGLSRLVILTAGTEDDDKDEKYDAENESEAVIPVLDKHLADKIQHELVTRSNIEKVVNVGPQPSHL